jgi:hypothetical protein
VAGSNAHWRIFQEGEIVHARIHVVMHFRACGALGPTIARACVQRLRSNVGLIFHLILTDFIIIIYVRFGASVRTTGRAQRIQQRCNDTSLYE